jgi:hypothetical protein
MQTENVDLRKEVFNKAQYEQVIDTNFSQLGVASVSASAEDTISVDEFFSNYNSIFYDIPPNGDTNSHRFLVEQSGQYINFDDISEEIIALQAEIADLRKELLAEQIKVLELESGVSFNTGSLDLGVDNNPLTNLSSNIVSGGTSANSGTDTNNSVY